MFILINSCLIIFLMLISFQDFKQREISWILIPLIFLALIFKATQSITIDNLITNTLLNLTFITIQLLLLTIYMSIKNKKMVNILQQHIGLGDLLFFVVLCLAFSPVNFIVFYILSLIATLAGCIIYVTMFSKKEMKEIPLAGGMASVLVFVLLLNKIVTHLNFYDDSNLLNIISN